MPKLIRVISEARSSQDRAYQKLFASRTVALPVKLSTNFDSSCAIIITTIVYFLSLDIWHPYLTVDVRIIDSEKENKFSPLDGDKSYGRCFLLPNSRQFARRLFGLYEILQCLTAIHIECDFMKDLLLINRYYVK